jgi:polysaccharide pyruvyl transferase WcaK-like protein
VQIALLSPAIGTGNIGDHFIEMAIRRLLGGDVSYQRFTIRRKLTADEIQQINTCDCAVICGTNLYQRDWHSELTPEILDAIRVPVIPFGVGSSAATLDSQTVGTATRDMIQALHRRCVIGSVRDPHAMSVAAGTGVSNALLTGCPVLFWSATSTPPVFEPKPRRRIIVTARNWLMHQWPDNVDNPVQLTFLKTVLSELKEFDITFAVHEDYDLRLIEVLGLSADQVFSSDDPDAYVALYTNTVHVVLAMRLHAGMLAVANGVPAVFVGHDTRTYSFCEMTGLPCIELFASDAAADCVAAIRRITKGDMSDFAPLAQRYAELSRAMSEFMSANSLPAQRGFTVPL